MKNKLWKQWMLSGVLVSAMVVSCGVSVSVQAEETTETEAVDWFTLPVHRMFHIHMKEVGGRGNVVTVGIFYNN